MSDTPRKPATEAKDAPSPRSAPGTLADQIVLRPPSSLRINPRNARIHSKKQIRQIANSIKATGFIGAIIADENDIVLAGVGRIEAAELIGLDLVPTLKVTGLTEAQKRAFVLADNKIAENAGWDREILAVELGELAELLPALNWGLTLTGFEPAEIDALFANLQDDTPDPADRMPPLPENAVTQPGDVWCLGPHRLLCGDARSQADLDRLMKGVRAQMALLDPPYNLRIADVQGRGRIKHREFAYASGEMSSPEYIAFLKEGLGNAARVSIDGSVHFVCTDWRQITDLITAGRAVYGAQLNLVVWAKTHAGQGSFYRSQHELIGVFRVGKASHQNNVELGRFGRNRSNLWTYAGVSGFGAQRMELLGMHPTVKPIALIADAIRDCTTKGDVVLDSFCGSGSTILAAEKVGRHGYALEFEPRYVDVGIGRWEAYTKSEAVLEGDGRTFAEVKAERSAAATGANAACSTNPDAANNVRDSAGIDSEGNGDWVTLCETVVVIPPNGEPK